MNTMNNYEYNEGIEFNGLMPKVMEADGVETIGASDFNARLFENGHLGCGSLEAVDFFETAFGGNGGDNSHEYVDLGLPSGTLWATTNIQDADGNELYFAWGETQGYTSGQVGTVKNFSWDDYKFGTEDNLSKYNESDGKTLLDSADDAAKVNWGKGWMMPTQEQFQELIDNTNPEWVEIDGVQGAKLTSKVEGYTDKFLFFPAVGGAENGNANAVGLAGTYWSSSWSGDIRAYGLNYGLGSSGVYARYRYIGNSVRPVRV